MKNPGISLHTVASVVALSLFGSFLVLACQNPFARPLPDSVNLALEILIGQPNSRSLSTPVDFTGKRLTVRLHAADASGQAGPVLSSFSTILLEPSATSLAITVPVTFNAVPTRLDLVLVGTLGDTDPLSTVYFKAQSAPFQASWTSAEQVELRLSSGPSFPQAPRS